jgi:hypothetical protein
VLVIGRPITLDSRLSGGVRLVGGPVGLGLDEDLDLNDVDLNDLDDLDLNDRCGFVVEVGDQFIDRRRVGQPCGRGFGTDLATGCRRKDG